MRDLIDDIMDHERLAIFVVVFFVILPYFSPPYISRGKPAVTTFSIPYLNLDHTHRNVVGWLSWDIPFAQLLWSIHIIIMIPILVVMAIYLFELLLSYLGKGWSVLIDGIKMISLPPPIITGITIILKPITIILTNGHMREIMLIALGSFSIVAIFYVFLGVLWSAPIEFYHFKDFVYWLFFVEKGDRTFWENIIYAFEFEHEEGWRYLEKFSELIGNLKWLVWLPVWILIFVFVGRILYAIHIFLDGKYQERSKSGLVDARPALIRFHNSVKTKLDTIKRNGD